MTYTHEEFLQFKRGGVLNQTSIILSLLFPRPKAANQAEPGHWFTQSESGEVYWSLCHWEWGRPKWYIYIYASTRIDLPRKLPLLQNWVTPHGSEKIFEVEIDASPDLPKLPSVLSNPKGLWLRAKLDADPAVVQTADWQGFCPVDSSALWKCLSQQTCPIIAYNPWDARVVKPIKVWGILSFLRCYIASPPNWRGHVVGIPWKGSWPIGL